MRDEEPMDLRAYEFVGELKGSLSAHAEKIYEEELKTGREKELAEALFRSITESTTEGTVRKPTKLGVICRRAAASAEEMKRVIEQFRAEGCSFLMPPEGVELDDETTIDISHESLIRQWQRLSAWAEMEAKEAKLYTDLKRDAVSWKEKRRNPDWLYTARVESAYWAEHTRPADDELAKESSPQHEIQKYADCFRRDRWNNNGRTKPYVARQGIERRGTMVRSG